MFRQLLAAGALLVFCGASALAQTILADTSTATPPGTTQNVSNEIGFASIPAGVALGQPVADLTHPTAIASDAVVSYLCPSGCTKTAAIYMNHGNSAAGTPEAFVTAPGVAIGDTIQFGTPPAPPPPANPTLAGPNAWGPAGLTTIRFTSAATDQPTVADCNNEVETTSASPVTVTLPQLSPTCPIVYMQWGAGPITFVAASGETVTAPPNFAGTTYTGAAVEVQPMNATGTQWNIFGHGN